MLLFKDIFYKLIIKINEIMLVRLFNNFLYFFDIYKVYFQQFIINLQYLYNFTYIFMKF